MKVSNFTNTTVERTGLADDGKFKIAFNAKMARILSDGLYSDKITSIIREISCNAIDSHVESGQATRPIEVHLPGIFEPWFHVRDFGVGLDHDQVMNIYTTYGASTKTNSNDFIGQLGLGSKSPFSYVDAFDVTAIKNGIMRQYSLYKSEDGMPSVALLLEQPTSEKDGVTVKMPVLQSDFNNFKDKAANVFRWFDVKPEIVGMTDFVIKPVDVLYCGTGWKIRNPVSNGYYDKQATDSPVALMGRVAYPIQANSVTGLSASLSTLLNLPLIFEFNIGDLEIAASREALGYDARTQANITDKLAVMLNELGEQFEQQMKDSKTLWQAHATFNKIFGHDGRFHYEFGSIFGRQGLKWNGNVVKSSTIAVDTSMMYNPAAGPAISTISGTYRRTRKIEYHRTLHLQCSDKTKIVFDDLERGGASRVNYYHTANNNRFDIYVFGGTPTISRTEMLELMGNPEYLLTSDLPKRPSGVNSRGQKVNMLVRNYRHETGKNAWDPVDVDLEDGGIYVDLDGWDVKDGERLIKNFNDIIKMAKQAGILDKDVVIHAPRGNFKKKLGAMPEWENMFDIIRDELKNRLTPTVMQTVSDIAAYNNATLEMSYSKWWKAKWTLVDTDGVFSKWINGMVDLDAKFKNGSKDQNLADINRMMGMDNKLPVASFDGADAWKKVVKHYPLLTPLLNSWNADTLVVGETQKHLQEYINLVDASITLPSRTNVKLAA